MLCKSTSRAFLASSFSLIHQQIYDYPDDFLETFPERIKQVTPEDIKRVISTYLKPDQFRILVVGKEANFDQPLSALGLGPVTKIDITILTVSPSQKSVSLKK